MVVWLLLLVEWFTLPATVLCVVNNLPPKNGVWSQVTKVNGVRSQVTKINVSDTPINISGHRSPQCMVSGHLFSEWYEVTVHLDVNGVRSKVTPVNGVK